MEAKEYDNERRSSKVLNKSVLYVAQRQWQLFANCGSQNDKVFLQRSNLV